MSVAGATALSENAVNTGEYITPIMRLIAMILRQV